MNLESPTNVPVCKLSYIDSFSAESQRSLNDIWSQNSYVWQTPRKGQDKGKHAGYDTSKFLTYFMYWVGV